MTLICGLPNAGKSTFSTNYASVIHFDEVKHRTADEQFHKCNTLAAEAEDDICVEGVYNTRKRRMELLEACAHKQGKRVCVWVNTPEEECLRREREYRRRPSGIVRSHARISEQPTLDEGWDEIWVV